MFTSRAAALPAELGADGICPGVTTEMVVRRVISATGSASDAKTVYRLTGNSHVCWIVRRFATFHALNPAATLYPARFPLGGPGVTTERGFRGYEAASIKSRRSREAEEGLKKALLTERITAVGRKRGVCRAKLCGGMRNRDLAKSGAPYMRGAVAPHSDCTEREHRTNLVGA